MAPDQVIAEGIELLQLIPQRPPFVMIDKLYLADDLKAITGLRIRENNTLFKEGFFTESGLMENMAQTAAAKIGYRCLKTNIPVPVGFIGAIKNLRIHKLPVLNKDIITEIILEHEIQEFSIVSGKVWCEADLLAECEMKIFLQKSG